MTLTATLTLGALYMDLYNPDARTMPFLSRLFNRATRTAALQPSVPEAATLCARGCNPTCSRLQPYVLEAATPQA